MQIDNKIGEGYKIMKIKTTRFGDVDVSDKLIFEFESPILGYNDESEFVLIEHKENSNFKWLQSTNSPELAFVVTMAGYFGIDYVYELPEATQEELEIETAEDILTLNIVLIPHENPRASTINLLAPLIFNLKTRKGSQVILTGTNFKVNHPLFENIGNEVTC